MDTCYAPGLPSPESRASSLLHPSIRGRALGGLPCVVALRGRGKPAQRGSGCEAPRPECIFSRIMGWWDNGVMSRVMEECANGQVDLCLAPGFPSLQSRIQHRKHITVAQLPMSALRGVASHLTAGVQAGGVGSKGLFLFHAHRMPCFMRL